MAVISQLSSTAACPPRAFYHSNPRHGNSRHNYFPVTTTPPPAATAAAAVKASAYNIKKNSSDKYDPLLCVQPIVTNKLFKATLFGAAANCVFLLLQGGGGGSNNAGSVVSGGGGGGAGKSGNFWSRVFSLPGIDKDSDSSSSLPGIDSDSDSDSSSSSSSSSESEFYRVGSPVYMLGRLKKYTISDVLFFDRRLEEFTDPTDDPLYKFVTIVPGQVYSRAQLQKELDNLAGSGLFKEVDIDCKRNRDGTLRVRISFLERTWQQPAQRIRCINVGMMPKWNPIIEISGKEDKHAGKSLKKHILGFIKDGMQAEYGKRMDSESARPCLLPMAVQEEISDRLRRRKNVGEMTARHLVKLRERVQQWYDDNGYSCAQVVSFGKLNFEELVCEVAEGHISKIQVEEKSRNDDWNDNNSTNQLAVVKRVLPHGLRKGEVFNIEAAEQAKFNIDALGVFTNTEFDLGLDEENGGGVIVKFKLERKGEDSSGDMSKKEPAFVYDD